MFTYRCPNCGKQHIAEKEPEQGFTATCLRCGGAIQVPALAAVAVAAGKTDGRKEAITRQPSVKNGKAAARKPARADGATEDESELAPAAEKKNEPPKSAFKPASKPSVKKFTQTKGVVLGGVLVVLLLAGTGAYFLFAGKKETKKTPRVAKKTTTRAKKPPKAVPKPPANKDQKTPVKPKRPEPVFKISNDKVVRLSAARLSAELAADPKDTNTRYFGSTLEVTGAFLKTESKESVRPPVRAHAVFATEGPAVRADPLGGPTPEKDWKALAAGKIISVRGAYSSDGFLHGCELLAEPAPPADALYKGKKIELTGYAGAVERGNFPTIRLERETNGSADIVCYFLKTDMAEVKRIKPGDPVVVRGTCNGRSGKVVRLDNCKLVYTTAPEGAAPRLEVVPFLRAYEEDLFPALRPAPGKEERVARVFTPRQLCDELKTDPAAWEKYRGKLLTVTGKVRSRDKGKAVVLGFEDTDRAFGVHCLFTRHCFDELEDQDSYRIRGLCTAMPDKNTIQLDNCELDDPTAAGDKRRLTAEFLPHTPGQNQTYDVSTFQEGTDVAAFVRLTCMQRTEGLTATARTHSALMKGASLLDPGIQKRWVGYRKTRKGIPVVGPSFKRRVSGKFVEVGELIPDGKTMTVRDWEPVLKIGARVGASWTWTHDNVPHKFTVAKFGEHKGRRSVTIHEVIRSPLYAHPVEIRHLYVEGIGEVERQALLRISPMSTRILSEKKLVEDMPTRPTRPPSAK